MNPQERHRRAMELFDRACELPSSERPAFLEEACGDDQDLLREVRSLLEHDSQTNPTVAAIDSGKGIEMLAADLAAESREESSADAEDIPEHIGRYRVIRLIDHGGMGTVYEAEQENPSRRVALKVIREGFSDDELRRRFQREAQVLGQLHHRGIAHIYEAGSAKIGHSYRPFFAMELIDGLALDEHARKPGFGDRERLELVARVCDAVQHAHQKGVLHRDLKMSNILVVEEGRPITGVDRGSTVIDAIGQPKVLDFGVARTIGDDDAHLVSQHTRVGQLVGTLAYMSPEQVGGESANLDTRSDVYSLGVILYTLLVKRMPLELSGLGITDAARMICEKEPPHLGSIEPRLRGDIETIVARAMEKDRERRYGSAADLAADIRHHLANEPIAARPPSAVYQIRKFARRHRGLVVGLALALVILVAGTVISVAFAIHAREKEKETQEANDRLSVKLAEAHAATDPLRASFHLDDVPPEA